MGHVIVGQLPKTQKWMAVLGLLTESDLDPAAVSRATVVAADRRLRDLRGDPSLTYCFWLLTRLASAARSADFTNELSFLGLQVKDGQPMLSLLAQVGDRTRLELEQFPQSGPFSDIAVQALHVALVDSAGSYTPSLLGSTVDDLAMVFRRHSTASQFGELATRFFGAFYGRTLRYYIDRAIPTALGGGGLTTLNDAQAFRQSLDRHARESAKIVERFAAQWYLKHRLASDGRISRDEAQRFTAHALTKLRAELLVDTQ
jgi:hypothetical protein